MILKSSLGNVIWRLRLNARHLFEFLRSRSPFEEKKKNHLALSSRDSAAGIQGRINNRVENNNIASRFP